MSGRTPAHLSPYHGYTYGSRMPVTPNAHQSFAPGTAVHQASYGHAAVSHHHPSTQPQQYRSQVRRRRIPQLPIELWMKIILCLPRRDLLSTLLVCRMFKDIAWKALLSTVYLHLEDDGTPESIAKGNLLLYNVATKPNWGKCIKHMVVFMDDQGTPEHVGNLLCALAYLQHLRSFKLVVTDYYTDEFPEYHGSIRRVVDTVFHYCQSLEELMVPHTMVWDAMVAMARQPRLRTLTSCSRLSADMQITDDHAARFTQMGRDLFHHSRGPLCPGLTTLRLDWNVASAIPQQVLSQLSELEIYNLDNPEGLFSDVLTHARRLRSLTIQQWRAPGGRLPLPPTPGDYLTPHEVDNVERDLAINDAGNYGYLTPLTAKAGDRHDPLRRLTSFRYIAYRGVLPQSACRSLLAFLESRTGLRRVDIKAVIYNKQYAEQTLRVLGKFRHLEALGIEFRDVRNGLSSGMELLRYIPRTVTHLKYNVIGWNLTQTPSTPDAVLKRALDKCPQLKFLYLYDGVRKVNGRPYQRDAGVQLSTPLPYVDFKRLCFLGLEHNWMDITRDNRGAVQVSPWPIRQCFYSGLEGIARFDEDGEWLARYNREMMDLSTYA